MRRFIAGIAFCFSVIVLLAANNRINWLTQILSPGTSTAGQLAGVNAGGANTWFKLGTNLSVDASGNINAASQNVTFHAAENLGGVPNGTLTTFTVPFTPTGKIAVDINGQLLDPSQFTVSGTTVTFTTAPIATDNLHATGISIP